MVFVLRRECVLQLNQTVSVKLTQTVKNAVKHTDEKKKKKKKYIYIWWFEIAQKKNKNIYHRSSLTWGSGLTPFRRRPLAASRWTAGLVTSVLVSQEKNILGKRSGDKNDKCLMRYLKDTGLYNII